GFQTIQVCGSRPILGGGISVALVTLPEGEPAVDLSWNQATDEGGGESDVVRYVIYRRETSSSDWGDPYLSIPAGKASYSYQDANVEAGAVYKYGLAAQDCTPSLSSIAASPAVPIPG
ncbi:hypothetical protein ACFL3S_13555, partial [Gemmatimonadota bacterium]